jgi:hypothetical protein
MIQKVSVCRVQLEARAMAQSQQLRAELKEFVRSTFCDIPLGLCKCGDDAGKIPGNFLRALAVSFRDVAVAVDELLGAERNKNFSMARRAILRSSHDQTRQPLGDKDEIAGGKKHVRILSQYASCDGFGVYYNSSTTAIKCNKKILKRIQCRVQQRELFVNSAVRYAAPAIFLSNGSPYTAAIYGWQTTRGTRAAPNLLLMSAAKQVCLS